jgi:hypothetical protein
LTTGTISLNHTQSLGPAILPVEFGGTAAEVAVEAAAAQVADWRRQQQLPPLAAAHGAAQPLRLSSSSPDLAHAEAAA